VLPLKVHGNEMVVFPLKYGTNMVTVSFENEEFGIVVSEGVTPDGIAIFTVLFAKLLHEILQI
jgi:hypothetical protein